MALCVIMRDNSNSKTNFESDLTDIINDITKLKRWLDVFTVKESEVETNPFMNNSSSQLKEKKISKSTPNNNMTLNKPMTVAKTSAGTKTAQTNDADSTPPTKPSTSKSSSTPKKSKKTTTKKSKSATSAKSKTKKPVSVKKVTKTKKTNPKKTATKPVKKTQNILEDELAETLTPEEIDSFQIERVDMDKLTHKICDLLIECESDGMLQADLYKKLKLSVRNGARLSLKLERMGTVSRVKILENERWTYKLILKKTPVSTDSLNGAPCLTCSVEQRCSVDGEVSPMTCPYIEDWVLVDLKRTRSK